MGICKYCGKSAGIFSKAHKECEEKHEQGLNEFQFVLSAYFTGRRTTAEVRQTRQRLMADAFLSEEDICEVSDKGIRNYTATLHRPYSPSSMRLMDDLVNALGVSYSKLSGKGGINEFTKKLMRGFMVEYFTGGLDLQRAHTRCEKVLTRFPMTQAQINDAYYYVLNKAATNFLKDGILTDDEQQKINDYVGYLALPINNLPEAYQSSEISKLGQASILKDIQRGIVPNTGIIAPIILGKKESVLWTYNGVSLYQEKITKEWVGRSRGMSFRVMKGVYYHTGGSKGHPVEHSSMEHQGTGSLFVTNKNLIFYSQTKGLKIPFNKIVGITPYSDGIEVHKDGANVKRITMQGFDPWFLMNLLSQMANLNG